MKEKMVSAKVSVGSRVYGCTSEDRGDRNPHYGKVIWVHPRGIFCRVEFDADGVSLIESFYLDAQGRPYYYTGSYLIRMLRVVTEEN